jgi:transposase
MAGLAKAKRDSVIVQADHRSGYTQREVAEFTGLHYVTVRRLQAGRDARSKT